MYERIPLTGKSRREWLGLRKSGLGGSDAAAVCGLNPYVSAMDVFQDKTTDEIKEEDSEAMRQGRDLEAYVADRFCEATGFKVRRSNMMYRSKEYPFLLADVDRLLAGEDAGLECKTASAYSADKWKDGRIPPHYLLQCCHYMAVTGKSRWYIAVVILGREFKYAEIRRDEKLIENLVRLEGRFWREHVEKGILPPPDGSEACSRLLDTYFGTSRKGTAVRLEGFDGRLERRQAIEGQMKELEKEQRQIDQEIKAYMKDYEAAYSDAWRVTWTSTESVRLDTKRIKEERPEIYQDFSNTIRSRRFCVKAA